MAGKPNVRMEAIVQEGEKGMGKMKKPKKSKALVVVKKRGAIGKYSEQIVQDLEKAILNGLSNKKACDLVGIQQDTFYIWLRKHPEFSERIKKARARKCNLYAEIIQAAGLGEIDVECPKCHKKFPVKLSQKQWQAIAWLAERTEPEEFGQKNFSVVKQIQDGEENKEIKITEVMVVKNE